MFIRVPWHPSRFVRWWSFVRADLGDAPSTIAGVLWGTTWVAALSLVKWIFSDSVGGPTPFLLYLVAIIVAAHRGKVAAGLIVTALSALVSVALFIPEVWGNAATVGPSVLAFLLEGGVIAVFTSRITRERPIRHRSRSHAGAIVVTRDVSLRRAEERRRKFLARATEQLTQSLDSQKTLATLAEVAVPLFADWCAVDMLENGSLKRLAVAHVDKKQVEKVLQIHQKYPPDPTARRGVHHVLRTGTPEMLREVSKEVLDALAQDPEHLRIVRALGLRSYVCAPLLSQGKAIGVISCVMAKSRRLYEREDLDVLTSLAQRAAIALENARLYSEAERAREEAERANRTKDEFMAMLGHELRSPLAPIQTALDLIAMRSDTVDVREYAIIARQVHHLVRLVDDLLDVSRITRGIVQLERTSVPLAEMIEQACEMVWPTEEQQATHQVHRDLDTTLVADGDPVRLKQIVTNLLINAAKYTPQGGNVWITCRRTQGDVEIQVRDDGIGIDQKTLRGVFESFVQAPQALDRARGGLGLGLSIVQGLVAAHGGEICAYSEGVGRGASFTVHLPCASPESQTSPVSRVQRPLACAVPRRVLLVEDSEDAAELLALLIKQAGHDVKTAASGEDALSLAREWKPTHGMLDIGLPGMDGYELAAHLKRLNPSIELIAISGYGQASDRARSLAAGFSAHLVKPIAMSSLWQHLGGVARSAS